MDRPDGNPSPDLSDTEVMEDIEYDSDSTNMSVSLNDESEESDANDSDSDSHILILRGIEESDIEEIEPGSPVIGERILQDGIVLSQRGSGRIRTPIFDETSDQEERRSESVETVSEDDEQTESNDVRIINPAQGVNIEEARQSPIPGSSASNMRQEENPEPIARTQSMVSSEQILSPQPGPSTLGDGRLALQEEPSIPHAVQEPVSDGRLSENNISDGRQSSSTELFGNSLRDSRQVSEGVSAETLVEESTSNDSSNDNQAKSKTTSESTTLKHNEDEASDSDDEGQICSICFEPWSNSGDHRLSSLKCGHIFGHACINRWLRGQGGKCPQCNTKATRKDIRVLYVKSLKALDTLERDRVLNELQKEKEARRKLEVECARTKMQFEAKSQMVTKLQNELRMLRNATSGSMARNNVSAVQSSQGASTALKINLVIQSGIDIAKEGGCRVLAYNEWLNMVVVSLPSQVNMFPGFGVKKINMLDVKADCYVPIHQKQLRDLAFNPAKNDLLLSVGMDKLVKLTNVCTNTAVGMFSADAPLWSCCWNTDQANQFFVGTALGSVIMYDTRNTEAPLQTFKVSGSGPIVSMCYVPYKANADFSTGGLLVAKLSSCSFIDVKDVIKDHTLPLEGPFTSVSFEKSTRHILVSCRPSQKHPHARHLVCELQTVNISENAAIINQVVTANVVQTFRGGTTQKVLSRSCLVTHPLKAGSVIACTSDESTHSVYVWDVSSGSLIQQLKCNSTVIDVIQIKNDSCAYCVLLTDKSVKFYKWVDML